MHLTNRIVNLPGSNLLLSDDAKNQDIITVRLSLLIIWINLILSIAAVATLLQFPVTSHNVVLNGNSLFSITLAILFIIPVFVGRTGNFLLATICSNFIFILGIVLYFILFDVNTHDIFYYTVIPLVIILFFLPFKYYFPIIMVDYLIVGGFGMLEGFELGTLVVYPGLFSILIAIFVALLSKYFDQTQQLHQEKQNEEQFSTYDNLKLQELGRITARITHDFNNILNSLKISTELISKYIDEGNYNGARERINGIDLSIDRTSELIKALYSYKNIESDKEIDVIQVDKQLLTSIKFYQLIIKESVKLDLKIDAQHCWVKLDRREVEQIFLNLIKNADQAISDAGLIEIRLFNLLGKDASYLMIEIRDTGKGISEKYQNDIFNYNFTLRHNGSGIGLSTVKSIVEKHNGAIELVRSSPEGTTFLISLPVILME